MSSEQTTATILHIDDDRDDLSLFEEAILGLSKDYEILQAEDGEQGLKKLFELKEVKQLPCLVVLDINMPRLDGRQTFQLIKADQVLSRIPLVIFSTSNSSLDKLYFKGENVAYITKPYDIAHLQEVARRLLQLCDSRKEE